MQRATEFSANLGQTIGLGGMECLVDHHRHTYTFTYNHTHLWWMVDSMKGRTRIVTRIKGFWISRQGTSPGITTKKLGIRPGAI